MKNTSQHSPELTPISHCDKSLDFSPRNHWPEGLPAVAVNFLVFAGFAQKIVFNHSLEKEQPQEIAKLFRSLYFELSFTELARLLEKSTAHGWFPIDDVLREFQLQPTEHLKNIARALLKMPVGFQDWCSEKKLSVHDLASLLSLGNLDIKPVLLFILNLSCSKSQGTKALELAIEVLLMGKALELVCPDETKTSEQWLTHLHGLRYPETLKADIENEKKMEALPWPGSSQARWVRQGDKSGIELKLFVSNPTDLKKYLHSLAKVQDLLENDCKGDPWIKH